MLVYPLHVRGVRTVPIAVLKVVDSGLSMRELVAKVTSPILSLPSENRSTNNFAAAFSISHAEPGPEPSEPERSMTNITLASRRVAFELVATVALSVRKKRMKMSGSSTLAVVVMERTYCESVAATLVTCRLLDHMYPEGKFACR